MARGSNGQHLIGHKKWGGRVKGSKNNTNAATIREMIITAVSELGGVAYLKRVAVKNPGPFLALIGRVLPTQIVGADGGPVQIERVERVVIDHAAIGEGEAPAPDAARLPTTH